MAIKGRSSIGFTNILYIGSSTSDVAGKRLHLRRHIINDAVVWTSFAHDSLEHNCDAKIMV